MLKKLSLLLSVVFVSAVLVGCSGTNIASEVDLGENEDYSNYEIQDYPDEEIVDSNSGLQDFLDEYYEYMIQFFAESLNAEAEIELGSEEKLVITLEFSDEMYGGFSEEADYFNQSIEELLYEELAEMFIGLANETRDEIGLQTLTIVVTIHGGGRELMRQGFDSN